MSLEAVDEREVRASLLSGQTATDFKRLEGSKLGGTPAFLQTSAFPLGEDARLLLPLDSDDMPFLINFGDGFIGYLLISPDVRQGRFLWDCR